MTSIFETEINVPQAKLAEFYAKPENSISWRKGLIKFEPLNGEQGKPGSRYRLIPKKGNMIFTATVISIDLPNETSVVYESLKVSIAVTRKFIALSPEKTKFISIEVFTFKGLFNKVLGFFTRQAIKKAHYKHMNDFKRVAEVELGNRQ